MKRCSVFLLIFFSLALLVGCGRVPMYVRNPKIQELSDYQISLLRHIKKADIHIIKKAMVFQFSIPTDKYFTHDTQALREHREKDLFYLAQFLRSYGAYFENPRITVTGHTDKVWLYPERKMLSMHYAQAVAAYLSQGGVNNMIVQGVGASEPTASNEYPSAAAYNRRVVVRID